MFYPQLHLAAYLSLSVLPLYGMFAIPDTAIYIFASYPKMFSDEEREVALDSWYTIQQQFKEQKAASMDYIQNSIIHDVDEHSISMSPSGAEGGEAAQGPRKISPRPWLMAPKNLAVSRLVAVPVTAVTAAALLL